MEENKVCRVVLAQYAEAIYMKMTLRWKNVQKILYTESLITKNGNENMKEPHKQDHMVTWIVALYDSLTLLELEMS